MTERAFEKWARPTLPFIDLEDWRVPIVHRERGHRVLREHHPEYGDLIDKWEKQGATATPDYLLRVKGQPILWVDVKDTQRICNQFNLNADKYRDYLVVSADTNIPASIVVFEMEKDVPRMWGYILTEQYNHIPLEDISPFEVYGVKGSCSVHITSSIWCLGIGRYPHFPISLVIYSLQELKGPIRKRRSR